MHQVSLWHAYHRKFSSRVAQSKFVQADGAEASEGGQAKLHSVPVGLFSSLAGLPVKAASVSKTTVMMGRNS
jgi:hypothetical protein